MAYVGQSISIPLGALGLVTDLPYTSLPPNSFIEAYNIDMSGGNVATALGATKFNSTALTGSVLCLFDWEPTSGNQRTVAVTSDGKVWRDVGNGTFNSYTPIKTGLGTLSLENVKIVEGGATDTTTNKKLFIFNGASQVQVIDGDGSSTADIATPAADWATYYPTGGLIHAGRLFAWGNGNGPHNLYYSLASNHEVFAGGTSGVFSVFPGDGTGIKTAISYKGRLFIFKSPYGVYWLDDTQDVSDPAKWLIRKLDNEFGVASPHSVIQVLNDLLAGNSTGSITSLQATDAFGDLEAGDILSNAKIENHVRTSINKSGVGLMYALYYPEKKQAMFTYRGVSSSAIDRILTLDIATGTPRIYWNTRNAPVCLALRKDTYGIKRPIYGDSSGFVYLMEQSSYSVSGSAYTSYFRTPDMDLGFTDSKLASINKNFEWLELVFDQTGSWNVTADIYIDGIRKETVNFAQATGAVLDSFILDTDVLGGSVTRQIRKRIHGYGRRIGIRVFNNTINRYFKIQGMIIGFRPAAEDQTEN